MKNEELKECFDAMYNCDTTFDFFTLFLFESQKVYETFTKKLPYLEDYEYNQYHTIDFYSSRKVTLKDFLRKVEDYIEQFNINPENCLPLICGVCERPFVYAITPLVVKSERLSFEE